jgi:hypothetical protein
VSTASAGIRPGAYESNGEVATSGRGTAASTSARSSEPSPSTTCRASGGSPYSSARRATSAAG